MKTGLYGGSFDPFHKGHRSTVKHLIGSGVLDQCVLMPAKQNPLKENKPCDDHHRLEMMRLAIGCDPRMIVSDWEINNPSEPSYSINALDHFKDIYDDLYLVIGSDNLKNLHRWYAIHRLLRDYRLIICNRPGYSLEPDIHSSWSKEEYQKIKSSLVDVPQVAISSTHIRSQVRANKPINEFVTFGVAMYIKENDLYKDI